MDVQSWIRDKLGITEYNHTNERTRYMAVSRTAPQIVYLQVVGENAPDTHNEYPVVREGPIYNKYQRRWLGDLAESDSKVYEVTLRPANEKRTVWVLISWRKVGRLRRGERVYDPDD